MNHEHEHSRASSPAAVANHSDAIEPGQSSRSALLRKLDHPVASGLVQRKARDANGVADGAEHAVVAASSSTGSPLPDTLMRTFERSLGADLSAVRIHTGSASEQAVDAVGAKAYTVGNDIHFGAGHYDPSSLVGQRLLAHEVVHTVQQSGGVRGMQFKLDVSSPGDSLEHEADRAADVMISAATGSGAAGALRYSLQRNSTADTQSAQTIRRVGFGEVHVAEEREMLKQSLALDYKKAKTLNAALAAKLGWEAKLSTAANGAYGAWALLWKSGEYDEFAKRVAEYQVDIGFTERNADGVLGPATWARLAGVGEAMASIEEVFFPESETMCYAASEERIKRGVRLATGASLRLPEDHTATMFDVILKSIPNRMLDIPKDYRGTGAAGALVYAGIGEFVTSDGIWLGELQPGAALQVWGRATAYDLLRAGRVKDNGQWRRLEKSLARRRAAAAAEPANMNWQRDLSRCHALLGGLAQMNGRFDEARNWFGRSLATDEGLVAAVPANADWQRDLAADYDRLGDIAISVGEIDEAWGWFHKALAVRKARAEVDSRTMYWQRDLAVSYEKFSDVEARVGHLENARDWLKLALPGRQAVVDAAPAATEWQRDLAADYDRLGDIAMALGESDAARDWFEKSFKAREARAAIDPDNTYWQHDLAVSHKKLGDVMARAGNLEEARGLLEKSRRELGAVAEAHPAMIAWQRDLCAALAALAHVAKDPSEATRYLAEARIIYDRLQRQGISHGDIQFEQLGAELVQVATHRNTATAAKHRRDSRE